MNTPTTSYRRGRVARDRCEVCAVVLDPRPDPRRRRCGDHLGQLDLFPTRAVPRARAVPSDAVRVQNRTGGRR